MPLLFLELLGDVVDQHLIEIVAAKVRIAVDAFDLENAVADVENRDVERAAAEVEHGDAFALLLVEAVGQRRGRRLVDDAHPLRALRAVLRIADRPFGIEAGDLGRLQRRLPLGVVEVGRHRDDRLAHGLAEVGFRRLLQLAQDHRRDFRRRVKLAVDVHLHRFIGAAGDLVRHQLLFAGHFLTAPAHEALDRINGAPRVGHGLPLGRVADEAVAFVGEGHHAGRQAVAFLVGDHFDFVAFHHGHDGVGRPQVDADDFFFRHHSLLFPRPRVSMAGYLIGMG